MILPPVLLLETITPPDKQDQFPSLGAPYRHTEADGILNTLTNASFLSGIANVLLVIQAGGHNLPTYVWAGFNALSTGFFCLTAAAAEYNKIYTPDSARYKSNALRQWLLTVKTSDTLRWQGRVQLATIGGLLMQRAYEVGIDKAVDGVPVEFDAKLLFGIAALSVASYSNHLFAATAKELKKWPEKVAQWIPTRPLKKAAYAGTQFLTTNALTSDPNFHCAVIFSCAVEAKLEATLIFAVAAAYSAARSIFPNFIEHLAHAVEKAAADMRRINVRRYTPSIVAATTLAIAGIHVADGNLLDALLNKTGNNHMTQALFLLAEICLIPHVHEAVAKVTTKITFGIKASFNFVKNLVTRKKSTSANENRRPLFTAENISWMIRQKESTQIVLAAGCAVAAYLANTKLGSMIGAFYGLTCASLLTYELSDKGGVSEALRQLRNFRYTPLEATTTASQPASLSGPTVPHPQLLTVSP